MLFGSLPSRSIVASLLSVRRSASAVATAGKAIVSISSAFDSGNIDLIEQSETVRLRIRPDPHTELEDKDHMQWFAFRSTLDAGGPLGATTTYEIENAGEASFPQAWVGSEVVVSHDRKSWHRVESTRYDEASGTLRWEWEHTASQPSAFFAYFDLYPYQRQLDLVSRCAAAAPGAPGLQVASIGQTLDGRELDVISVGTGPLSAWVIHRQHPGESQAGFFAEGLLSRLLGLETGGEVDGLTRRLLEHFTWHVLPSMNPDGASRGHLRTNAQGANLNREWGPATCQTPWAVPVLGLCASSGRTGGSGRLDAPRERDLHHCSAPPHGKTLGEQPLPRVLELAASKAASKAASSQLRCAALEHPGPTGSYAAPTLARSPEVQTMGRIQPNPNRNARRNPDPSPNPNPNLKRKPQTHTPDPSPPTQPSALGLGPTHHQVYHTLAKMEETGVDLFIDVHGDEALPFAFLAGAATHPLHPLHPLHVHRVRRASQPMQLTPRTHQAARECRAGALGCRRYTARSSAPTRAQTPTCRRRLATTPTRRSRATWRWAPTPSPNASTHWRARSRHAMSCIQRAQPHPIQRAAPGHPGMW